MNGNVGNIIRTSLADSQYNCIAWAAEDTSNWWWPDANLKGYWPSVIPREETLDAFIQLFKFLGYTECGDSSLEEGYDKIAIYCDSDDIPTHASRQLSNGQWTSKLGPNIDVSHNFRGLLNVPRLAFEYGNIAVIMKRSKHSRYNK